LNGRELIGIGDNRGVEYDLYPSEIMTGAVIYKSADAGLTTQGLGGTVDLRTVRPLDAASTLTVNGTYELNGLDSDMPEYGNSGTRYAVSYVDQFADDTIGLALAIADTASPLNSRTYETWGYSQADGGAYFPNGGYFASNSKELERTTISAILQYSPSDDLDIVVDYLDIDFSDSGVFRGYKLNPGGGGGSATPTGFNVNPVMWTEPNTKDGTLESFGANVKFKLNDSWTAVVDVSSSETSKEISSAESYAGINRFGTVSNADFPFFGYNMDSNGAMFTGTGSFDASSFDSVRLTGPQDWGYGLASQASVFESNVARPLDGKPFDYVSAQDGFWNNAFFDEKLTSTKFQVEGDLEGGFFTSVLAGVNYSDRTKIKDNNGFFSTFGYPYGDGNADGSYSSPVPEQYRLGVADLSWIGLGGFAAYDALGLYKDGAYYLTAAETLEPDRLGDTFSIEEQVTTFFVKGDFETQIAGLNAFGNVGVQVVKTDQSSDGYIGVVNERATVCLDAAGQFEDAC
jgi:iron complex outermembrane receptor protein